MVLSIGTLGVYFSWSRLFILHAWTVQLVKFEKVSCGVQTSSFKLALRRDVTETPYHDIQGPTQEVSKKIHKKQFDYSTCAVSATPSELLRTATNLMKG